MNFVHSSEEGKTFERDLEISSRLDEGEPSSSGVFKQNVRRSEGTVDLVSDEPGLRVFKRLRSARAGIDLDWSRDGPFSRYELRLPVARRPNSSSSFEPFCSKSCRASFTSVSRCSDVSASARNGCGYAC